MGYNGLLEVLLRAIPTLLVLYACTPGTTPTPKPAETGETAPDTSEEISADSGDTLETSDTGESVPPADDTAVEAMRRYQVTLNCDAMPSTSVAVPCAMQILADDGVTRYRGPVAVDAGTTHGVVPTKPSFGLTFQEEMDPLVSSGSTWRYLDSGDDPGADWASPAFNDGGWPSGPSPLGYGESDLATTIGYGADASNKYAAAWFRTTFEVPSTLDATGLSLSMRRDDGALVYLNGVEIFRDNLPSGTITGSTWASANAASESTWVGTSVDPGQLLTGTNLVAVEVHQASASSSDLTMDLALVPSGGALPVDLVGTGDAMGWSLNGVWLDRSLLRTHLGFELYRAMGRWAPATMFGDLTYGGAVYGVYLVAEEIRALPDRLDLVDDGTGAMFVVQLGETGTGLQASTFAGGDWIVVWPDSPSEAENIEIGAALHTWETGVLGGAPAAVMDLADAADFVILQEFSHNWGAYTDNLQVYRGVDGLIRLVVGDFDLAYGFPCDADTIHTWNDRPAWVHALAADPTFASLLPTRWRGLRETLFSLSRLGRRFDAYVETLGTAPAANFSTWPFAGVDYTVDGAAGWCPATGWSAEVDTLHAWLGDRLAWMDDNIGAF